MMKRKILAVVLPIVGCATVVGSGFSAWFFGDYINDSGSISAGVHVTDEISTDGKNLEIDTSLTTIATKESVKKGAIVLDQGGPKNTRVDSGIMFGTEDDKEVIDTRTATTNESGTTYSTNLMYSFRVTYDGTAHEDTGDGAYKGLNLGQLYEGGMRIRISVGIELKGDVTKYITFKDAHTADNEALQIVTVTPNISACDTSLKLDYEKLEEGGTNQNKLVGDYIVTKEQVTNNASDNHTEWVFTLGLDTEKKSNGDYSNALLKWKDHSAVGSAYEAGKPANSTELDAMRADLTDSAIANEIVFSVAAYIEDDPTR